jgi:hypothetical protein
LPAYDFWESLRFDPSPSFPRSVRFAFRPERGSNKIARGIAPVRSRTARKPCPERAEHRVRPHEVHRVTRERAGQVWGGDCRALSGRADRGRFDSLGRCPRLICGCPFGAKTQRRNIKTRQRGGPAWRQAPARASGPRWRVGLISIVCGPGENRSKGTCPLGKIVSPLVPFVGVNQDRRRPILESSAMVRAIWSRLGSENR